MWPTGATVDDRLVCGRPPRLPPPDGVEDAVEVRAAAEVAVDREGAPRRSVRTRGAVDRHPVPGLGGGGTGSRRGDHGACFKCFGRAVDNTVDCGPHFVLHDDRTGAQFIL